MIVSLIVAMDGRGLIGDDGRLPWHLPRDLRRFREITWGKPILMGRKTFASIGRPLPGRLNVVLSHRPDFTAAGCAVAHTVAEALSLAEAHLAKTGGDEAVVVGGAAVYAEALPLCDRLYLTLVEGRFDGSTWFPLREAAGLRWRPLREPESFPADEKNPHPDSFHVLERVRGIEGLDLAALLARAAQS